MKDLNTILNKKIDTAANCGATMMMAFNKVILHKISSKSDDKCRF